MLTYLSATCAALVMLLAHGSTVVLLQRGWTSLPDRFSHSLGNCEECKPGEAMAVSVVTISHSNYVDINSPPCADPLMMEPALPKEVRAAVARSYYKQVSKPAYFAVGLTDTAKGAAQAGGRSDQGGVWEMLKQVARLHQTSSCGRNIVIVPKKALVTRVEESMQCPAGGWCGHQSKHYVEDLDDDLRVYTVVGKNWSHNKSAATTLKVFYTR